MQAGQPQTLSATEYDQAKAQVPEPSKKRKVERKSGSVKIAKKPLTTKGRIIEGMVSAKKLSPQDGTAVDSTRTTRSKAILKRNILDIRDVRERENLLISLRQKSSTTSASSSSSSTLISCSSYHPSNPAAVTASNSSGQVSVLKVVWNTKLQLPMRVESTDATSRRQTVVQVLGAPASRPWDKLQGFTQKDYSDYLD